MIANNFSRIFIAALLALATACASSALAAHATLTDGSVVSGKLSAADAESMTIESQKIPISKIVTVDWGVLPGQPEPIETIVFTNGDRITGKIIAGGTANKVVEQETRYGKMAWHAPSISKIIFDHSTATVSKITLRTPVGVTLIQGEPFFGERVLIAEKTIRVTSQVFGKEEFPRDNVALISITEADRQEFNSSKPYVRAVLRNGDMLSGYPEKIAGGKLTIRMPFYTFPAEALDIPLTSLSRLIVMGGNTTYLSDVKPADQKNIPYLFNVTLPARNDLSLSGGPITVAKRQFLKGICARAKTELTYTLGQTYDFFEATIGVDDATIEPGAIKFLVYGESVDTKPIFESELIQPGTSKDIRVPVTGLKKMVLVVQWGEKGDIGAQGCWGEARVIRK